MFLATSQLDYPHIHAVVTLGKNWWWSYKLHFAAENVEWINSSHWNKNLSKKRHFFSLQCGEPAVLMLHLHLAFLWEMPNAGIQDPIPSTQRLAFMHHISSTTQLCLVCHLCQAYKCWYHTS